MKLTYDFSGFYSIFKSIKDCNSIVPLKIMDDLKKELNKFFKDSNCTNVSYTNNLDKQFFGIKVYPELDKNNLYDDLSGEDSYRVDTYSVEIDSKLMNVVDGLNEKEMTAVLLKEVNGLISDSTPMEKTRNYLSLYLTLTKTTLKISNCINYKDILAFGVKDYMSKCNSISYLVKEDLIVGDELSSTYGFYEDLESGFNKIRSMKPYEDNNEQSIGIVFSWILRLYNSVSNRRIGSIKTLKNCKELTGSKFEKIEFNSLIKNIERLDDSSLLQESLNIISAKMLKMRIKTIKSMENDFYEIAMQVKNVEDEDDAIYLIRQINSRMSMLSDYIDEGKLPEKEKQSCMNIYDRYFKLREELARTQTYKRSTTAIYVNYPEIKDYRS